MESFVLVVLVLLQTSLIQSHEINLVVPLYRLLSQRTGNHFYTTSSDEATHAVTNLYYTYEGLAGSVATSASDCQKPVYRLYRAGQSNDDHFYTMDEMEANVAAANLGYVREGIAYYCASALNDCGATLAFNRYYRGREHFYTTDLNEGHQVTANGGRYEGVLCYIWP